MTSETMAHKIIIKKND